MGALCSFRVLRAITLSGRFADRLSHLRAAHVPEFVQLGPHARVTFRGDQRGTGGAGGAITAHKLCWLGMSGEFNKLSPRVAR